MLTMSKSSPEMKAAESRRREELNRSLTYGINKLSGIKYLSI